MHWFVVGRYKLAREGQVPKSLWVCLEKEEEVEGELLLGGEKR
jgi:hypothetical protein